MRIALLRLPVLENKNRNRLINPSSFISSQLYHQWLTRYPPMGLLYYASLLKQKGHEVNLIDAELMSCSVKRVFSKLSKFKPDIVCSSVNIFVPRFEFNCLRQLKDKLKFVLICRGHFPRLYPEETINNPHVDFAFTGKGFHSICQLTEAIQRGRDYAAIPGIIYRKGKEIIKTPEEPLFKLDDLPYPARELLDNSIYTSALSTRDKFTTIIGSAGCPYSCTYCEEKNTPFQTRDVNNIIAEMKECKYRFGINEVFFFDPTFTIDRARTMDFCQKLLKENLEMKWVIRTRADLVDAALLEAMAKAGCIKIHYGLESGDQEILDKLKRNIKLETMKKAVELNVKNKIAVFGYFMIGNDGETINSIRKTIVFARSLPLNFAQFTQVAPIPQTDVFKASCEKLKVDLWLENYRKVSLATDVWKSQKTDLSNKTLRQWTNKAYLAFYLRPSYLWRTLNLRYAPFYIVRQLKIFFIILRLKLANFFA